MRALFLLVALALLPLPLSAHNGTIGQALPVEGIVLDGELHDWPAGLTRYPIAELGGGVPLEGEGDFEAWFMVGYDRTQNALYVAVETRDNSLMAEPPAGTRLWHDTQDGCELYFDLHEDTAALPTQLRVWGDERGVEGPGDVEAFQVEIDRGAEGTRYEWRVDLDRLGRTGAGGALGFDVSLWDMDADGAGSWVSWSPGAGKWNQNERIGDMLLVDERVALYPVRGRLGWADGADAPLPRRVRLQNAGMQVQATVDSLGHYEIQLPRGEYAVEAVDEAALRLMPGKALEVMVDGPAQVPPLHVQKLPKPGLVPQTGILLQQAALDSAQIGRFVRAYMDYHRIPGLSLALIKDNEIAFVGSYGVKHMDTGEKVDERTLFEGASMTKTVFAYAVGRLVDRGEFDLDTPLHTYWSYEDIAYDERYKKITARTVLSHRTGFPNWRPGAKLEILFDPGTDFGYSGEGFEFLKMAVSEVTGKAMEDLLQEEVFGPLGMGDACVSWRDDPEAKDALTAHGHVAGDQPSGFKWNPGFPQMASSLHVPAGEYAKFAVALLRGEGLSPAFKAEMLKPHSQVPEDWDDDASGLGIFLTETPFGLSYGHGGSNPSFRCEFSVYPEHGIGYVYMANSDQGHSFNESLKDFLVNGSGGGLTAVGH